jgi:hypothetical protein
MLVLFILLFISCALGFILDNNYFKYLKEKHPETWRKLGEPSLFYNNSMKMGDKIKQFESNKEYIILNDVVLTRIINFRRNYYVFYLIIFLSAITTTLYIQFHK